MASIRRYHPSINLLGEAQDGGVARITIPEFTDRCGIVSNTPQRLRHSFRIDGQRVVNDERAAAATATATSTRRTLRVRRWWRFTSASRGAGWWFGRGRISIRSAFQRLNRLLNGAFL
jgi:hypothetical protein